MHQQHHRLFLLASPVFLFFFSLVLFPYCSRLNTAKQMYSSYYLYIEDCYCTYLRTVVIEVVVVENDVVICNRFQIGMS